MLTPDAIERIRNEAYSNEYARVILDESIHPLGQTAIERCRRAADEAERRAREIAERGR